jgi:hypothetical protein
MADKNPLAVNTSTVNASGEFFTSVPQDLVINPKITINETQERAIRQYLASFTGIQSVNRIMQSIYVVKASFFVKARSPMIWLG